MIVTTVHGRYRVEEPARGWFVFTLLDGPDRQQITWCGSPTVHQGPLRLGVGLGLCFDADAVQLVECACNRITALEP
jgi:hypothetical protein